MPTPLPDELLEKMHAYWRAANDLSVGQIYLQGNPLLASGADRRLRGARSSAAARRLARELPAARAVRRTRPLLARYAALAPTGHRRMGSNPHANGGDVMQPLSMPDFRDYAVPVATPGGIKVEATRPHGLEDRDFDALFTTDRPVVFAYHAIRR